MRTMARCASALSRLTCRCFFNWEVERGAVVNTLSFYQSASPKPISNPNRSNPIHQQRLEVDERAVFLKFELFSKRLGKLCEMFTSIHQISGLEQHTHITGARAPLVS